MNAVLRVSDARFVRDGLELIAPYSIVLAPGERATLTQPNETAAKIAARIAAGIVKPTCGTVFVGDFDARVQPAQAKRLVGFVAACGFPGGMRGLEREVRFRADVWDLDAATLRRNAEVVSSALELVATPAYARAVALALAPDVAAIVLEQPPLGIADALAKLRPAAALLTTCAQLPTIEGPTLSARVAELFR
jgi:ABC-type Na+ transport system ATPase subunit NatA